jgi:hypothetical protein
MTSSGMEYATIKLSLLSENPRYPELCTYPKYYSFTLLSLTKEGFLIFEPLRIKKMAKLLIDNSNDICENTYNYI